MNNSYYVLTGLRKEVFIKKVENHSSCPLYPISDTLIVLGTSELDIVAISLQMKTDFVFIGLKFVHPFTGDYSYFDNNYIIWYKVDKINSEFEFNWGLTVHICDLLTRADLEIERSKDRILSKGTGFNRFLGQVINERI